MNPAKFLKEISKKSHSITQKEQSKQIEKPKEKPTSSPKQESEKPKLF